MWIQSDGGPLVAMPFARRGEWEGSRPPTGGRVVKATVRWDGPGKAATDYDEAVDAEQTAAGGETASTCSRCGAVRRRGAR